MTLKDILNELKNENNNVKTWSKLAEELFSR
jgi:hypothetical protein